MDFVKCLLVLLVALTNAQTVYRLTVWADGTISAGCSNQITSSLISEATCTTGNDGVSSYSIKIEQFTATSVNVSKWNGAICNGTSTAGPCVASIGTCSMQFSTPCTLFSVPYTIALAGSSLQPVLVAVLLMIVMVVN